MISRENHRYIKSLNREQFSNWLYQYFVESYNDGAYDTEVAIYRNLIDKFNFADDDIARLKEGVKDDIDSINRKYITAQEIMDGLEQEGFKSVKK